MLRIIIQKFTSITRRIPVVIGLAEKPGVLLSSEASLEEIASADSAFRAVFVVDIVVNLQQVLIIDRDTAGCAYPNCGLPDRFSLKNARFHAA